MREAVELGASWLWRLVSLLRSGKLGRGSGGMGARQCAGRGNGAEACYGERERLARVLALSGEGRQGVVVRTVESGRTWSRGEPMELACSSVRVRRLEERRGSNWARGIRRDTP